MPSGRRRPPFNSVVKESEAFLSYLRNKECPDIFKRNELRALYDGEFVQSRRSASRDYVKVAFRAILLDLKHTKRIHELGDYFSFAKDIQMLYEKLSESSEFQSQLEEWKKIAEEKPYFCETCGIDCVSEKNLESHINGNRHSADHIIVFQRFVVLWDTGMFKVYELGADKNRKPVKQNRHLQFGQKVELVIVCSAPLDFGNHFVPLSLYFVKKDKQTNVVISEEEEGASQQDFVLRFLSLHVIGDLHETLKPVEPFKFPEAMPDRPVEKTEPGEPLPEKKNELTGKLEHFPIPRYLPVQVQYGMTGTNITGNKQIVNAKLREMLSGELTADTYRTRFSTLLWVEQIQMKKDITRYDLVHVTLDRHPTTGRLILQVPGLLERRPSVLRGDRVYIYSDDNRAIRYEGIVHLVELEQRFDIRFDFSPLNLWVMHRAVKYSAGVAPILFPTQSTMSPGQESITLKPWFDRNLNDEQQTAVKNIVQGTSRPAPYIIFGPPGTGKTVTVTEAIRQVYHGQADSQILVCCPENTASDHVFKKLISTSLPGPVKKADIFRLYAVSRAYASVPNVIRESKQFNYDPVDKDFFYPTKAEVKGYRVLVVTLMTASRLVTASFPKNHYTHIFIDEGAHAQEPECVVPISGLLDPSNRAECDVSFMERMMRDIGEYSRGEDGVYDNRYITKLVRNYRSHDDIIYVPRALFYDGELTAAGDEMILNSMDEVSQVDKYLQELLRDQKGGIKLKPSDIGIISPYRKQVAKIREMIKLKGHSSNRGDIMVGSVEEFQGQEFKRFNVAVTRARALLIVIGNPVTLEQDKIWKRFIEYCDVNGGFKGQRGKLTSNHGLQADTEEKRGENRTIYIRVLFDHSDMHDNQSNSDNCSFNLLDSTHPDFHLHDDTHIITCIINNNNLIEIIV
ncbi:M10B1-like protein [Mya arenaria]|uniref:RNA helicase n=1 Tax=Mya arenaria TaxID=6604 RepID=A0ABY7G951_MYAAR|nr:M10B1-like protein [Mya arenaria]